jgi:ATP-dependent DNA helicase RecG
MQRNGSPLPVFDTDEGRTYFLVRLPIHQAFLEPPEQAHDEVHDEVYDEVYDEARVEWTETERVVLNALRSGPLGAAELLAVFGFKRMVGGLQKALNRLQEHRLIEFTIPDKPRSKKQKRRLTPRGERLAAFLTSQSSASTKK